MYDAQAELGRANDSIAKHNLALQDGLYALRSETQTAFDQAKAFEARWKEVEKEQRDVYQRYTPQFLLMRLRHSITAQDDASEALVSAFNQQKPNADGSTKDADEFIKEFKEMRKIYHKRAMWDDRWSQGRVEWNDE
ncbi:hypothetical protein E1B28_012338 [Marasmius oreades]|nr:uncharacterized protein E1B28_012338 [Marasmius oreades]KAG7088330.1 hypothetical protein E1B28_012338 [Marasmius oreades]